MRRSLHEKDRRSDLLHPVRGGSICGTEEEIHGHAFGFTVFTLRKRMVVIAGTEEEIHERSTQKYFARPPPHAARPPLSPLSLEP